MLLKLGQYLKKYEVNKFECAAFSCFPDERETLFFGGETVLKIKGALQWVDGVLMKYDRFMEPINAFSRMMNGLSLKEQEILKKKKSQRTMKVLIKDILRSLVLKQHECESPKYIQDLVLFHHQSTHRIRLLYDEMISEYQWLDCILKNGQTVDMVNVAILFSHSEHITFRMAEDNTLSETESQRVIENLVIISGMALSVNIGLIWPSKIPKNTRNNLRNALISLYDTNWQYHFEGQQSLWFISEMEEVRFDFEAQHLFQEYVQNMISILSTKPKSEENVAENCEKLQVEVSSDDHVIPKIQPEDDGVILTIYEYSNLLLEALQKYSNLYGGIDHKSEEQSHCTSDDESTLSISRSISASIGSEPIFSVVDMQKYADLYSRKSPLMTFCLEMALFVAAPNHAFMQYDANKYLSPLTPYCIPSIAHLIYSFIRDKDRLEWVPFEDKEHDRYLQQINFSEGHNVVDFKNMRQDYVIVHTHKLPMIGRMRINVYCFGKGDEMWLGLMQCDSWKPARSLRTHPQTLTYYGGYGNSNGDGGSRWGSKGSIQGSPEAYISKNLSPYGTGDWICFDVDFDAKTVEFSLNGTLRYTSKPEVFPVGDCYFVVELDDDIDQFYIEQGVLE